MSYCRWSADSDWYIFNNVNGFCCVWHIGKDNIVDWNYDDLLWAYLTNSLHEPYVEPTQLDYLYEKIYIVLEEYYGGYTR